MAQYSNDQNKTGGTTSSSGSKASGGTLGGGQSGPKNSLALGNGLHLSVDAQTGQVRGITAERALTGDQSKAMSSLDLSDLNAALKQARSIVGITGGQQVNQGNPMGGETGTGQGGDAARGRDVKGAVGSGAGLQGQPTQPTQQVTPPTQEKSVSKENARKERKFRGASGTLLLSEGRGSSTLLGA